MPKQLNVNLAFTADTGQAKAQIEQLQNQLTSLINSTGKAGGLTLTKDIQQATIAAAQLKAQIKSATDVDTGKLDLTKFTQSMTQSGMSLKKYQQQLSQLGPAGDKAFSALAASINNADAKLNSSNALLTRFATTLKNTARWQISSSILHGFIGSVQAAYGYAQDLNQSLNNIRIVTGASVDEMSAFAAQANQAARALSTTTTSYTDAALIYYQQGIRDQEQIAQRTETTIKLANVSRQSAEEVSQEMTAIWNNFYDGSKSLEFYADAITALGATTASSSQEIATGLEKFAAISKTVGLSYEYATAALATITAQTRQSADTVGTGLRTLFSRLEGLKLGETLEDGVDLNKYSAALDAVGVQVLDINGDIRDMDSILDDLGSRWDQLSQAQKIALAQTVGGVRQYTNLIALMDNWDKMQQNVLTAQGAEGTLQEQADIYAESWEAAQKRVRAVAEDIYQSLFDDKFFIKLTNGLASFLNVIGDTIDGLGGMKGALLLIGSIVTKVFGQDMSNAIAKMTSGFQLAMMGGQQYVEQQRREVNNLLAQSNVAQGTTGGANIAVSYQEQAKIQNSYLDVAKNLSAEQQNIAQILLDQNRVLGENVRLQAELTQQAEKTAAAEERELIVTTSGKNNRMILENQFNQNRAQMQQAGAARTIDSQLSEALHGINWDSTDKGQEAIQRLNAELKTLEEGFAQVEVSAEDVLGTKLSQIFERLIKHSSEGSVSIKWLQKAWSSWTGEIGESGQKFETIIDELTRIKAAAQGIEEGSKEWDELRAKVEATAQAYARAGQESAEGARKTGMLVLNTKEAIQVFQQFQTTVSQKLGQGITALTSSLMSFGMALSSIKSLGSIWSNEDISLGDKLISTMTSLGIIVPSLTNAFKAQNREKIKGLLLTKAEGASLLGIQKVKTQEGVIRWVVVGAKKAEAKETEKNAAANTLETVTVGADAVGHTTLAAAIWEVVSAKLALLAEMLPYLAMMTIAIFTITAIIKIAKGLADVYNADALAANRAKESATQLAEQLQNTKQAYEDLKTTIENYQGSLDALKTLTKGTQEWKEQVRETNEQALKLINTFGLVRKDYDITPDGIIKIKDSALTEIEAKESERVARQQRISSIAQNQASQRQTQADLTAFKRQQHSESILLNALLGGASGFIAGNIPGALIGATIGGLGSSALNAVQDEKIDKAITRLTTGDLANGYSKGQYSDSDLAEKLDLDETLIPQLKELVFAVEKNTAAHLAEAEATANDLLSDDEKVQGSYNKEDLLKAATHITSQIQQEAYQKALDLKYTDISDQQHAEISSEWMRLMQEYAADQGLDQLKNFNITNYKNGKYKYRDENGNKKTGHILDEDVAAWYTDKYTQDTLKLVVDPLVDTYKELDDSGTAANQAIKHFISKQDFSDVNQAELKEARKQVGPDGKNTEQFLGSTLGDKDGRITDEEAQQYGFNTAKEFINGFYSSLQQAESNFASIAEELSPNVATVYKTLVSQLGDITLGQAQTISGNLQKIYENSGGNLKLVQNYSDMMLKIGVDNIDDFNEAIAGIDWKTATIDTLTNVLDDLGLAGEFTTGELTKLFKLLKLFVPESEEEINPEDRYKSISDITNGLTPGKTITPEQYAT